VNRPNWRSDAAFLAGFAVLLRLPAFFATRSLVFDDGVYASSALAMRAGAAPFRDVFSSQGPMFLPLVWLGDLIGFRTLDAPRVLSLVSGVVLTIAVYSCARRVTSRGSSLLAAGLVTTSGSALWVTGPANADGPSLALSVLAIALALRALDHHEARLADAVFVGLAAGGAVSIKALSVPAVAIAGLVLLAVRRRLFDGALAAMVAVGVYLAAIAPWGFERVWDQSFTYHNDARRLHSHPSAAWKVVTTLWGRDRLVLVALTLALATIVVVRVGRIRPAARDDRSAPPAGIALAVLALWAALVFALLVWEPALFRAHVAHLVPPLALVASLWHPPWRVLAVAAVVAAPFWALENRSILWPRGYDGNEAAVVARLRALPHDSVVISDDPGLAWRAGHRPPPDLADPSFLRIEQHRVTERSVARAATPSEVCGVVVSSRQHFMTFADLGARLEAEGYRPVRFGSITLYTRRPCG
jgi:hypothetical protein